MAKRKLPENMFERGKRFYYRQIRNGLRVRKSLGGDFDQACRRLRSLKSGEVLSSATFQEAAERWLDVYVAGARPGQGLHLARQRMRDHSLPLLGHVLLHKISKDDLRTFSLRLGKRKVVGGRKELSIQSVRHVCADVRCCLLWCEDSGLIERAPIPRKFLPKMQEQPPKRLTDAEVDLVLAVPEPYAFIVRLGLGTGLRWGEMNRMQSTDIQGGSIVVHNTKSGKIRRVPLPPELQEELKFRAGRILPLTDPGGFARYVRQFSGVVGFHAHQLRHTYACRWLESGGSLAALQELMGHASIVTTQRYARLAEAHVKAEADRIFGKVATAEATPPLRFRG